MNEWKPIQTMPAQGNIGDRIFVGWWSKGENKKWQITEIEWTNYDPAEDYCPKCSNSEYRWVKSNHFEWEWITHWLRVTPPEMP